MTVSRVTKYLSGSLLGAEEVKSLSDVISEILYCLDLSAELTNCTCNSSVISSILDKLVPKKPEVKFMEKDIPSTLGISSKIILLVALFFTEPIITFLVLINSGASFSIANILYVVEFSITLASLSSPFLKYKEVSKSTLFLSEEGNANHRLPSSALYQRSIAKL